jgi:hypothetical protein
MLGLVRASWKGRVWESFSTAVRLCHSADHWYSLQWFSALAPTLYSSVTFSARGCPEIVRTQRAMTLSAMKLKAKMRGNRAPSPINRSSQFGSNDTVTRDWQFEKHYLGRIAISWGTQIDDNDEQSENTLRNASQLGTKFKSDCLKTCTAGETKFGENVTKQRYAIWFKCHSVRRYTTPETLLANGFNRTRNWNRLQRWAILKCRFIDSIRFKADSDLTFMISSDLQSRKQCSDSWWTVAAICTSRSCPNNRSINAPSKLESCWQWTRKCKFLLREPLFRYSSSTAPKYEFPQRMPVNKSISVTNTLEIHQRHFEIIMSLIQIHACMWLLPRSCNWSNSNWPDIQLAEECKLMSVIYNHRMQLPRFGEASNLIRV